MNGRHLRLQLARVAAILIVCSLAAQAPAWAQALDGWSFVVTPQVWISHIAKNGFASAPNTSVQGGFLLFDQRPGPNQGNIFPSPFSVDSSPNETVNPQWGVQFAAQKGRLTLAGAFQYVNFETRNDITFEAPQLCLLKVIFPNLVQNCINPGDRWAQEFVDTTRMDVDLSASYFFPDVVKEWLDFSLGGGFKFIYASASRDYSNMNPVAATLNSSAPGLYTICFADNCSDASGRQRVEQTSYLYAATFPMSATLHLTKDARWLLPFSITPLIGAETRHDNNIVYSIDLPGNVSQLPNGVKVNRQDGTTFAYGVTADMTVRWLINETFSAYAGMRVQYINGHDEYLAYGPLVGMSVRFGGK